MRKSNKQQVLKKKDRERNLHFPSCTPDVQAALRETRRTEWKKWLYVNAGDMLTDEEVRQLTETGCEIYPMNWSIQTETRICDETTIMLPFLQSTRVDWLVVETSRRREHFAQIFQLVMWIRTTSFAVGVHKFTSPSSRLISRLDTSKDKELFESFCTVFQLKVSQKKRLGEEILASRVPVYGTTNAGRGLWLRIKNTCKQFNVSLNKQ